MDTDAKMVRQLRKVFGPNLRDMILGHLSGRLRRLTTDYVKACAEAAEGA